MIGPTVTVPRNATHPLVKPIRLPKAYRGKRALPPATGYIPPSSARVKERSITAPPPSNQEMTAAGPASEEAYRAPNSQPAPMIDPKETNRSPRKPTSRRSLRAHDGSWLMAASSDPSTGAVSPHRAGVAFPSRCSEHQSRTQANESEVAAPGVSQAQRDAPPKSRRDPRGMHRLRLRPVSLVDRVPTAPKAPATLANWIEKTAKRT